MEKKTININPDLFDVSNKKKDKKKLPLKIPSDSNVKKNLINKIKNHQKTKKNHSKNNILDFDNSIANLKNIINDIKENNNHEPIIHTSLPSSLTQTDTPNNNIPWGNLKNGSKPTYRTWLKSTQKNKQSYNSSPEYFKDDDNIVQSIIPNQPNEINDFSTNQPTIDSINNSDDIITYNTHTTDYNQLPKKRKPLPIKKKRVKKKTTFKKYTCGKSKTKKFISIIIKDPTTKDKILNEKTGLSKIPIKDVKQYLYDKSFIKIGSNAPDDILRAMYESCILSGNVTNDNSEMIIHNYMNAY